MGASVVTSSVVASSVVSSSVVASSVGSSVGGSVGSSVGAGVASAVVSEEVSGFLSQEANATAVTPMSNRAASAVRMRMVLFMFFLLTYLQCLSGNLYGNEMGVT